MAVLLPAASLLPFSVTTRDFVLNLALGRWGGKKSGLGGREKSSFSAARHRNHSATIDGGEEWESCRQNKLLFLYNVFLILPACPGGKVPSERAVIVRSEGKVNKEWGGTMRSRERRAGGERGWLLRRARGAGEAAAHGMCWERGARNSTRQLGPGTCRRNEGQA